MTTLPLSKNIFPTRSRPCWEPPVTRMLSSVSAAPLWDSLSARNLRKGGTPRLTLYCRDLGPTFSRTTLHAFFKSSTGKSSGAGSPPAKEIISGLSVIFRISRMAELFISCAPTEKVQFRFKTSSLSKIFRVRYLFICLMAN